jgi:hypothetical protein
MQTRPLETVVVTRMIGLARTAISIDIARIAACPSKLRSKLVNYEDFMRPQEVTAIPAVGMQKRGSAST